MSSLELAGRGLRHEEGRDQVRIASDVLLPFGRGKDRTVVANEADGAVLQVLQGVRVCGGEHPAHVAFGEEQRQCVGAQPLQAGEVVGDGEVKQLRTDIADALHLASVEEALHFANSVWRGRQSGRG